LVVFGLCLASPAELPAQEPPEALSQRISRLILQLGHSDFFQRERAQEELIKIGPDAFDALTAALNHEDIEIAARASYLVRAIRIEWTRESDPPEVKNLLSGYEGLDSANRLQRMGSLAALPGDVGVAPLCRLVRYEKSELLSKHAALKIVGQSPTSESDWPKRRQIVLETLGNSTTPGAAWLRLYVETAGDPQAAAEGWAKVIAAEETALTRSRQQTDEEVLTTLLRRQLELFEQLGRDADAQAVITKIVGFEKGSPQTLTKLLDWLVEKQAWQAVDLVATRFAPQIEQQPALLAPIVQVRLKQGKPQLAAEMLERAFETNPLLVQQQSSLLHSLVEARKAEGKIELAEARVRKLIDQNEGNPILQPMLTYTLAEVQLVQDKPQEAEATAQKALALNAGMQDRHYQAAVELHQRGLMKWSEAEYRKVVEIGPPASLYTYVTQSRLAEILHDRDDDLEAAKVLQAAVDEVARNAEFRAQIEQRRSRGLPDVHSRMFYYYACHYGAMKDHAKQLEYLDKAVEKDVTDADALIALYRLPNQDDARRKKTLELIRAAADEFRRQIQEEPGTSTPYNQLAWLVSNTEGDQAEALRCSLRSLELQPGAAGYMDTLGRCYYALGDLENAVKHQSRAVELEPHSNQMRRQLELFRKALEASKTRS
jgi:tetratricopeptide (TPR) repeat protein